MTRSKENARLIARPFYGYLQEKYGIRTFSKPELRQIYFKFKNETAPLPASFSNVLFQMARGSPNLAKVRNGYVFLKGSSDWANAKTNRKPSFSRYGAATNPEHYVQDQLFKSLKQIKNRDALIHNKMVGINCIPEQLEVHPGYYTCDVENQSNFSMVVQNKCNIPLILERCLFLRNSEVMTLSDVKGCTNLTNPTSVEIGPGEEYEIIIRCCVFNQIGSYCSDAFFQLTFDGAATSFLVLRYIRCYKTNEMVDFLKPTAPYKRPERIYENPVPILRCEPLLCETDDTLQKSRPLPPADIPLDVKTLARDPKNLKQNNQRIRKIFESDIDSIESYKRKFSLLLHLEEYQASFDIETYRINDATLRQENSRFRLQVPGLAERRPSVLRGDKIYLKSFGADVKYEGRVIKVERDSVLLAINKSIHQTHVNGSKYNVSFTFNRLPMKLQHRAISGISRDHQELIFPKTRLQERMPDIAFKMFNKNIEHNEQQAEAVKHIVFGKSRVPYIIYGPPGTGKTVTIVEAIQQVHKFNPKYNILVCAPSNSASDLLAMRLVSHIDKEKIFRMHAMSRKWTDVHPTVQDLSNHNGDDFYYPSRENLMKYSVIITTLITAGRISSAEFPNDHFDFVFIDEAGHAFESECMTAIEGVLATGGRVVLAGDPKQLGPIVRSSLAKTYGLEQSYIERLMTDIDIYQPEGTEYDNWIITKLLENYRSHPDIINIPNECFYESELQVMADLCMRESLCKWEHLPKQDFPLIFHGICGRDVKEENSPSYFNGEEAAMVYDYVKKLLETRKQRVLPSEIGIIAPYRKQVEKLRKLFESKKINDRNEIKIGSVEEFQGQERKVIIITTVRSDSNHLPEDKKFQLGFLQNPKRFNVAITRAKCLLIVIGNPNILCLDYYWKQLIEFSIEKGGYRGIAFTLPETPSGLDEDIINGMEELGLGEAVDISATQEKIDPPWRYNEH